MYTFSTSDITANSLFDEYVNSITGVNAYFSSPLIT